MGIVVKLLIDDDGSKHPSKFWHYVTNDDGSNRSLCTGECFGEGESTAKYKIKEAKKGSVTCESCKAILKKYQSYKF